MSNKLTEVLTQYNSLKRGSYFRIKRQHARWLKDEFNIEATTDLSKTVFILNYKNSSVYIRRSYDTATYEQKFDTRLTMLGHGRRCGKRINMFELLSKFKKLTDKEAAVVRILYEK